MSGQIAALWKDFEQKSVSPQASQAQRAIMRATFYAACGGLMALMVREVDKTPDESAGVTFLEGVASELQAFILEPENQERPVTLNPAAAWPFPDPASPPPGQVQGESREPRSTPPGGPL